MNKLHKQLAKGLFNEAFHTVNSLSEEEKDLLFNSFSEKQECSNLLHQFFKFKSENREFWFELFLRYFKPQDIVWGIRCNRACFDKEYDTLFSVFEKHEEKSVRAHYGFWKHIQPLIAIGIEERETLFNNIEKKSLHEWLLLMALWYEEKRALLWKYDDTGETHGEDTNTYVNSLNQFLDYLLHNKAKLDATSNDVDSINNWVIEKVCKEKEKGVNPPEFVLLDRWLAWHYFITTILDSYCFDESYDIRVDEKGFHLYCNDYDAYFRWKLNGAKLNSWILKCEEDALKKVIQEAKDVPGDNPEELLVNLQEFKNDILAENLLNYYNLRDAEDFPISGLIEIVNDFSFSGYKHWVTPLDKLYQYDADNWYKHILKAEDDILADENYTEFVKELKSYGDSKRANEIQKLLILDTDRISFKQHNPFQPKVNIYRTPFIKINNTLLSFTAIIGEARSGLYLIENSLRWLSKDWNLLLRKKQTDEMEKRLADIFKEKRWKNVVFGLKYDVGVAEKEGDFDVLVYEKGILLQIELKRSQLRFTLEEAQNEKIQSIEKAARQLQKGKKFIEENPAWIKEQLGLKPEDELKEIYSLHISTSFENDHELINGSCKKISLFELEEILYNSDFKIMRANNINPLGEIMRMIEMDYMWQEIEEETRDAFKAPGETIFYFRDEKAAG